MMKGSDAAQEFSSQRPDGTVISAQRSLELTGWPGSQSVKETFWPTGGPAVYVHTLLAA